LPREAAPDPRRRDRLRRHDVLRGADAALPHYVRELGLSKAGAGVLAGAYPAGTLAAAIPAGMATSRFGVKRTVVFGLSMLVVTTIVFGLADSEWLLITARFAQGVSSSFSWAASLTWITVAAPFERRGEIDRLGDGHRDRRRAVRPCRRRDRVRRGHRAGVPAASRCSRPGSPWPRR